MIKVFRCTIPFLLSIFPFTLSQGQNYFISNLFNNQFYSNPSYPLVNEYSVLQLNYRNQWPVSNLYTSYGITYLHYADKLKSNFGAMVNYDNQFNGTFSKISPGINYAYKLQITRNNHLTFGLQGFYHYSSVNYSNLTFENQQNTIQGNQSQWYSSVNSGIGLIINQEHFIGLSGINLYSGSTQDDLLVNVTYIGDLKLNNYYSEVFFQPLINISTNFEWMLLTYGANIDYDGFKAGLALSQSGLSINTFIILLGISFENYEFVYTYDLNLSGAVSINPKMAAHEVTFLRKFQYKGRRTNRRGAIKCPDI